VKVRPFAPITFDDVATNAESIFSGVKSTMIEVIKTALGLSSDLVKKVCMYGMGVVVDGF